MKTQKLVITVIGILLAIIVGVGNYIKSNDTINTKKIINILEKDQDNCFKILKLDKNKDKLYEKMGARREIYVLNKTKKIHDETLEAFLYFYDNKLSMVEYSKIFLNGDTGYNYVKSLIKEYDKKYKPTTYPGMGLKDTEGDEKRPNKDFYETWSITDNLEVKLVYEPNNRTSKVSIQYGKPSMIPYKK